MHYEFFQAFYCHSIAILHFQRTTPSRFNFPEIQFQIGRTFIPIWFAQFQAVFYSSRRSVGETIIVPLISARWFCFSSNYSLIMRRDNNTSRGRSKMHDLCVCLHSVTFNGLLSNSSIFHFRIIKQFRSSKRIQELCQLLEIEFLLVGCF